VWGKQSLVAGATFQQFLIGVPTALLAHGHVAFYLLEKFRRWLIFSSPFGLRAQVKKPHARAPNFPMVN
jgi:hypothetical protein